jgi:predicted nucleic acid-binding protein
MPVLDTNFLILLARGDPKAKAAARRLTGLDLIVPAQAAMEYLCGIEDPVAELQGLRESFRLIHTTDEVVLEAVRLRMARRPGPTKPNWGDLHIAAVAALGGTYVVTTNKRHFTQLDVPAWHFVDEADPPMPARATPLE